MTSAEIVIEFVRGRPGTLAEMTKQMNDAFRAPEAFAGMAQSIVQDALRSVSAEERESLDRMRGNGPVDWQDVAKAFMEDPP